MFVFLISSCKKEDTVTEHEGDVTVSFDARVGNEDFGLNKTFNIDSHTYNFKHLRYWVSNVSLIKNDGSEYKVPEAYYLIEETDVQSVQDGAFQYPAKKREDVEINKVPLDNYRAIKFSIGVDAPYNDNLSLQSGELSQLNGMTNISWMWHTSYIFSSLSGTFNNGSGNTNIRVETGLNDNYKTVTLDLPSAIKISSAKKSNIVLYVDIAKIIADVDLTATPIIGAAQADVMKTIAGNFATKVFAVQEAK